MSNAPNDLETLVCSPTGQDGLLISNCLEKESIQTSLVSNAQLLCKRIKENVGAVIISSEFFSEDNARQIQLAIAEQPSWSDLPLIILTPGGRASLEGYKVLKRLATIGNATLLERPFQPITLISALQVALRARKRQYEVKALLEDQIKATLMRDEFISIASHELKTPVTALKLLIEINERKLQLQGPASITPEKLSKFISDSKDQLIRLTRLIDDMFDAARLNSGKLNIQETKFDISLLVQTILARLENQLNHAKCTLHQDIDPDIIGCWDSLRIEQVISNLIVNAIRYCPGQPVMVRVKTEDKMVVVTVTDHGPGISSENITKIFERYGRGKEHKNVSGLGLGLYISRQIVETHGGSLTVESEMGRGSSFIVKLPL